MAALALTWKKEGKRKAETAKEEFCHRLCEDFIVWAETHGIDETLKLMLQEDLEMCCLRLIGLEFRISRSYTNAKLLKRWEMLEEKKEGEKEVNDG